MANIFSTSISGLLASQRALATTSHNIANVNTEGYSRQRVEQSTRLPQLTGAGFVGTGVQTSTVQRLFDQSRELNLRQAISDFGRHDMLAHLGGRVDNLLGDEDAGLSEPMQAFFNAVQDVANDPTSTAARQAMLSQGESLASRFRMMDQRLNAIEDDLNTQLKATVEEINGLASAIARLNEQIVSAQGKAGQPANDLLDKRDTLIRELSEKVDTRTVTQDDGSVNVFVGNGQGLVLGNNSNPLATRPSADDPRRLEVVYERGNAAPINLTRHLSGGRISGLLDFREQVLEPTRADLDRLAVTIAETFNAQHRLGLQFDTEPPGLGADFFRVPQPRVIPEAGDAEVQVGFNPERIGDLRNSDYRASFDGTVWTITRLSDGTTTTWDPDDPQPVDGLDFSFGAGAQAGDSVLVRPLDGASAGMQVNISRPDQIAAANPLSGGVLTENGQTANTGSAAVDRLSVSAMDAAQLQALRQDGPLVLRYEAGAYHVGTLDGDGDFVPLTEPDENGDPVAVQIPYDPATDSNGVTRELDLGDYGSFSFRLSGVPDEGDALVIGANDRGEGDNANALKLAGLADEGALNGGKATYQDFYGGVVGRVGTETMRAQTNQEASKSVLDQARQAREEVSGVNLEEEAVNLLRFQQAFQANAQVITVANTLFQTMLDAVKR